MRPPKLHPHRVLAAACALLALPLAAYAYVGSFSRLLADDYCTAVVVQAAGLLGALRYWYFAWTGRYAYILFTSAATLPGPGPARYLPGLLLAAWGGALAWALRQARPFAAPATPFAALWLAGLIIVATLNTVPSVAQSLYWLTGSLNSVPPLILWCVHAALVLRQRGPFRSSAWALAAGLGSAGLAFAAAGFSESAMAVQVGLYGLALAAGFAAPPCPARGPRALLAACGLAGSLAGLAVVALAPGNAARQAALGGSQALFGLAALTVRYAAFLLWRAFTHSRLSIAAPAILPGLYAALAGDAPGDALARPARWRLLAATVLAAGIAALFAEAPAAYALGSLPPGRALIAPQFVIVAALAGASYLIGLAAREWRGPIERGLAAARLRPWLAGAALAAVLALGIALPVRSAWQTLQLAPRAAADAAAWDAFDSAARAARQRGDAAVSLPAPQNIATLDVIEPPPGNYVNQCASDYYGLAVWGEAGAP